MQNEIEIAVVLSCEHDAKVVVTHTKHDVVYQRPGEAPSTGIGGVEGLRRHCSVPLFGRGPSPRDRRLSVRPKAAITAKTKRPHAGVTDPSLVDGVRPMAGQRISAN